MNKVTKELAGKADCLLQQTFVGIYIYVKNNNNYFSVSRVVVDTAQGTDKLPRSHDPGIISKDVEAFVVYKATNLVQQCLGLF